MFTGIDLIILIFLSTVQFLLYLLSFLIYYFSFCLSLCNIIFNNSTYAQNYDQDWEDQIKRTDEEKGRLGADVIEEPAAEEAQD